MAAAVSFGESTSMARSGAPGISALGSIRLARSARTNETSGARLVWGAKDEEIFRIENLANRVRFEIFLNRNGQAQNNPVVQRPRFRHDDQLALVELVAQVIRFHEPVEFLDAHQRLGSHGFILHPGVLLPSKIKP